MPNIDREDLTCANLSSTGRKNIDLAELNSGEEEELEGMEGKVTKV
jgi:hypothetical protein